MGALMPSLATFYKDHCVPCGQVMVHNSDGCTHCKIQRVAPVARDIASLTFGAQSERVANLRRARNRAAVVLANRNRPRPYGAHS